jgi:hypothetical protein
MKMKTKVEIIDEVEGQGKNHYRYEITRDSGEPRDTRRPSDKVQVTAQVRGIHAPENRVSKFQRIMAQEAQVDLRLS